MKKQREILGLAPVGWTKPSSCGGMWWSWNPADEAWVFYREGRGWVQGDPYWQWSLGEPTVRELTDLVDAGAG